MNTLILTLLFSSYIGVIAILPNYDDSPSFENGLSDHMNNKIFPDRVHPEISDGNRRIVRKNDESVGQEKLDSGNMGSKKLKNATSHESLKDLEKMISHPTWLTDSSMKKPEQSLKFLKNSMPLSMRHAPAEQTDSQREHIKEVIEKFQRYKPKPITDNRITKFVFTNDADLATSKTVQEHNKEVAKAFIDFNKKLEETMSNKPKQKLNCLQGVHDADADPKHPSFLDKSLNRLKSSTVHKQVCSKHNKHMEENEMKKSKAMQTTGARKFEKLARMRGDLEGLLNLDRPKIKFKRNVE